MMEYNVGKYHFPVKDFNCDFTGKIAVGVLGAHILNCSNEHAERHGFGIGTYNSELYTWVISRLIIDFKLPIRKKEKYTLSTWVNKIYNDFINRQYNITDETGKVYAEGHSVWSMINFKERQPVKLEEFHGGDMVNTLIDKENSMNCRMRKERIEDEHPYTTYKVRYSDLDINRHFNSIKYIEHALDLVPIELIENEGLKRLEIAYATEAKYNDELVFYRKRVDDTTYYIEIRKENEKNKEIICRCKFIF